MVAMPAPDPAVLSRRDAIIAGLRAIVPGEGVIVSESELRAYESDGLTAYRQPPLLVVLPSTTEQVSSFCGTARRTTSGSCRAAREPRFRAGPCRLKTP